LTLFYERSGNPIGYMRPGSHVETFCGQLSISEAT
jgi:hypothetical protein